MPFHGRRETPPQGRLHAGARRRLAPTNMKLCLFLGTRTFGPSSLRPRRPSSRGEIRFRTLCQEAVRERFFSGSGGRPARTKSWSEVRFSRRKETLSACRGRGAASPLQERALPVVVIVRSQSTSWPLGLSRVIECQGHEAGSVPCLERPPKVKKLKFR